MSETVKPFVVPEPTATDDPMADFERVVRLVKTSELELLVRKQRDYGPGNIANCPLGPVPGLIVRLYDKVSRLANLYESGRLDDPENEAVVDTFADIANYGTIGTMVLRGVWPDA